MSDSTETAPETTRGADEVLAESLREFQKLHDAAQRKAYYEAHPELKRVYSETNFHA